MKKVNLLNLVLLFLITSCKLKQFTINDNIKVKMPPNVTIKPASQLTGNLTAFQVYDKVYTVNGVLVSLSRSKNESYQGVSFDELRKTEANQWQKAGAVQLAEIETYSGKRFLVLNLDVPSTSGKFSEYVFISDTEVHKPIFIGTIRYYKATQRRKAMRLLKTILTSTKIE